MSHMLVISNSYIVEQTLELTSLKQKMDHDFRFSNIINQFCFNVLRSFSC